MIRVLFICHGNICRSTMAEFVMKDIVRKKGREEDFYIESAATSREEIGNDTHPGTKRILDREGISYERRRARQVTAEDCENFDYLIIMDEENRRGLGRIVGKEYNNKVYKLMEFAGRNEDVADPWYTGNFDITYSDVKEGTEALYREICKNEK